jgi:2-polyprenyl-6-methoxyphenol hydroxylase-like FAD-dependent oxidoreductase
MTSPRILIVGAGIAGLSVARALHLSGLVADVVERESVWQPLGSGLYLPANAVRALNRLGLGDELAARANRITQQRFLDARGRPLLEMDVRSIWGDVGECLAISRHDLHALLRNVIEPSWIRMGVAVTDVGDAGTVMFDDGSSQSYDLVIGADGIGSTVRRHVFGPVNPRFLNQVCWRFIVENRPDISQWSTRLGAPGRSFTTVQLGGGRVYCYAEMACDNADGPGEGWRDHFAEFAEPVAELLGHADDAYFAPLHEIDGSDWVRPKVVLIGDSAHACSPSMAQGGAMALEDGLVLAELLQTERVEQALTRYRERRAGRMAFVLKQNRRRDRARLLPVPVRNGLTRTLGKRLFIANHAQLLSPP